MITRGLALLALVACGGEPEGKPALPAWPLTGSCRDGSDASTQAVVCELRSRDGIPVQIHVGDRPPQHHLFVGETATLTLPAGDWPLSVTEVRFTAGTTELRIPLPFVRLAVTQPDDGIHVGYTLCAGCTIALDDEPLATQAGPGELVIHAEDLNIRYLASYPVPDLALSIVTADGKRTEQRLNVSTEALLATLGPTLRSVPGRGMPWSAPLAARPPWPAVVSVIPDPADPRERVHGVGGLARIRDAQIIVVEERGEDGGVCPGLYRESGGGGMMQVYRATPWSKLTAFEARTGRKLGQKKLVGTRPTCPSQTWDVRIEGKPPDDQAIVAWLATLKS